MYAGILEIKLAPSWQTSDLDWAISSTLANRKLLSRATFKVLCSHTSQTDKRLWAHKSCIKNTFRACLICSVWKLPLCACRVELIRRTGQLRPRRGSSPGLAELSAHSLHSTPTDRDLFVPSSFVLFQGTRRTRSFCPLSSFASIELISLWVTESVRNAKHLDNSLGVWGHGGGLLAWLWLFWSKIYIFLKTLCLGSAWAFTGCHGTWLTIVSRRKGEKKSRFLPETLMAFMLHANDRVQGSDKIR